MKLYTEEQLLNTIKSVRHYADWFGDEVADERIEKHLKALAPIELPTDEEIEESYYRELEERREIAKNYTGQVAGRHPDMFGHNEVHHMVRGYLECIKWVKEQINNLNK